MTNSSARSRKWRWSDFTPYYLIAPAIIIIVVVMIIPILNAVRMSMTDATLLNYNQASFVGLRNYSDFTQMDVFLKVMTVTLIYVAGSVILTYVVGLLVASLLNSISRFNYIYRAMAILPWAVPQVVLVLLWQYMLNPQFGVLNFFMHEAGLIPRNFSWFGNSVGAMAAILVVTLWKQYPLSTLMLLAGMKSIPKDQYEAAAIDGANTLNKFIHITLPGLRNVSNGLLLLLTIWSFGNFVIIWLMTQGGPADSTSVLTIYTYLNAFKYNKLGFGAAIGVICLLISLVFSFVYYRLFIQKTEVH